MSAEIAFTGELNDFLAPGNRGREISYQVDRRASIKDVIEALGPPHTEVGSVLANGREVGFEHLLAEGERIEIFPIAPPVDVTRPSRLRPALPRLAFLVDENVGGLAMLLRMLGLDAAYERGWRDEALAEIAAGEGRVVLSKDTHLLRRKKIEHGRLVRATKPDGQLVEVARFYGVGLNPEGPGRPALRPFSRCLRCNVPLEPVAKADIIGRLLPLTKKYYETFRICPRCERIYWPGSHHERMRERLRGLGIAVPERPDEEGERP